MKLSYNWLCEFVDLNDLPPQELARLLTLKSCEVESVTPFMEHLAEIRVAQIETITPHPAADKLKVCSVAIGHETVQIVTGADNAEVGKKYPLALAGVKLPDGRTLGKAKLRGVESAGMLCSGGELGLSALDFAPAKLDGVMPLPDEWQVGQPLSLYLAPPDTILEIDNKSITHRPDLWCHFGFAREIAALLGRPLKHNPEAAQYPTQPLPLPRIVIEDSAAITYCGAELRNFHIGPSPLWVQLRLLAVGQKPINNIVDISNYVLFEMGQPNHAFDREKLGECVRVSYSRAGEKITLLDGSEWILPEKLVLIRDGEKPVALAGVMGGAGTETTAATKRIFLESATFHRSDIRRAVAATGLRTDSSQRFEKAQNPGKARAAIFRFAELLAREQPGVVLSEIAETSTVDYKKPQTIQTNRNFLAQKLGPLRVAQPDFAAILRQLGFTVSEEGDNLSAIVPDWRKWFDVTIAEDLVEEIGRFIGYGEVATEPLLVPCETPRLPNPLRELEHRLRELCALRLELTEIKSYAFHSAQDLAADEFYTRAANAVAIRNSLHADLSFLRISPLPGLLRAVHANYREHRVVRLFEIEKIFLPSSVAHQPSDECLFLAVAAVADEPEKTAIQFAAMIAEILASCGLLRHEQYFRNVRHAIFHPGRSGSAGSKDKAIFRFGEIHPRLLQQFGIKKRVWYCDALLRDLLALRRTAPSYRAPFSYPSVSFELTLVMPRTAEFARLREAAGVVQPLVRRDLDKTVLTSFEHLTTFTGGTLRENEKAVSVRAVWRNPTRTITAEEVKKLQEDLIARMQKAGFVLRGSS